LENNIIESLMNIVENACKADVNIYGYGIWSHHIKPMLSISKELALTYVADTEIVTISTLLHDLAGIKDASMAKEHHIYGALQAEELLKSYNYPVDRIELVKKCIINHRGSVNNTKGSIEEICLADSDAIAHIQEVSSLFYLVYKEMNLSIEEGTKFIKNKITRDWNKMSSKGQSILENRYLAVMNIL
jgi:HD superfamily phosphodiesterase